MRRGQPTKAKQAQIAERRAFILRLASRNGNLTYQAMADLVIKEGLAEPTYTKVSCLRDFRAALDGFADQETVTRMRQLQNAQLNDLLRAMLGKAVLGDPAAAMAAIRAMERKAKLNGLDAVARTALEIDLHIEQASAHSVAAVAAAMDAAELSPEQRSKMVDAIRAHFHGLDGRAQVIELEAVPS